MSLIKHIKRQRKFSTKTFGPGPRTNALLDHIRKELLEIEIEPDDLKEWIDVVMLALDGAWRAGYTPYEIATALTEKQAENEARNWPDWRTADPDKAIEHVRALTATEQKINEILFCVVEPYYIRLANVKSKDEIKSEHSLKVHLGMDSLDSSELLMAIEEKFSITITDEDWHNLLTVGDIYDCVEAKLT